MITLIWLGDKLVGVVPKHHATEVVADLLIGAPDAIWCQDIEIGDYGDEGLKNAGEFYFPV